MPHGALRNDDNDGEAGTTMANSMRKSKISLQKTVGAAFPITMKEKNNGPHLAGGPIFGKEDLILVGCAAKHDGAVEETSFVDAGQYAGRQCQRNKKKRKTKEKSETHDFLQGMDCSMGSGMRRRKVVIV